MKKERRKLIKILTVAMLIAMSFATVSLAKEPTDETTPPVEENNYKVNVIQPERGKITVTEIKNHDEETGQSAYRIRVRADKNYSLYRLYIDGKSVGRKSSYLIEDMDADVTVKAEIGVRIRIKDPEKSLNNGGKNYYVRIGSNKTVNLDTKFNRQLISYKVNGKVYEVNGQYDEDKKVYLRNIRSNVEIIPTTHKAAFSIMLDAGHQGRENRGVVRGYYESKFTWKFTEYQAEAFKKYEDVIVNKTRSSQTEYLGVVERGAKGKDHDLVLSNHTNWSSSEATDYPCVLLQVKKAYRKKTEPIAHKINANMHVTMNTRQEGVIVKKAQRDGSDWYGFLRGASKVGAHAMLVEHSFHSNPEQCRWLMNDKNIKRLAEEEAAIIAEGYGLKLKKEVEAAMAKKTKALKTAKTNISKLK